MNCPICRQESRVLEKNGSDRRRECTKCLARFTTTEVLKAEHKRLTEAVQVVRDVAEKLKVPA